MGKKTAVAVVFIIFIAYFYGYLDPLFEATFDERESNFSPYSDEWNGLSVFREEALQAGFGDATIISTPLALSRISGERSVVYTAIGVENPYKEDEESAILDFLGRGGKAIIADDHGNADGLLRKLGIEIEDIRIWSTDFEKNESFPIVTTTVGGEEYRLVMNYPSILNRKMSKARDERFTVPETIITTSSESWKDSSPYPDGNERLDLEDEKGAFPVAMEVVTNNGEGRAIIFSDSGMFMNTVMELHDNREFVSVMLHELFGLNTGVILFDESRHVQETPMENSFYTFESFYLFAALTTDIYIRIVAIIVILYIPVMSLFMTKKPVTHRNKFDTTYHSGLRYTGRNRNLRVKKILHSGIQLKYNLIMEEQYAYDPRTREGYNLSSKKDLVRLLGGNPKVVRFLMKPDKDYTDRELYEIIRAMSGRQQVSPGGDGPA